MDPIHAEIRQNLLALSRQIDVEELFPTVEPGASEFMHQHPFAFCAATCLDRGARAEIIWTIPFWIFNEVGHFDPNKFNQLSLPQITQIFLALPRKPRYINAAPRTFQEITRLVVQQFGGDASRIWSGRTALEVRRTFLSVYGVGPGIANMAVLLIEKAYNLRFSDVDHRCMDIKPDVNTMRVLYRLGLAAAVDELEAVLAARNLNPAFPGEIDGPLWLIGKKFCTASRPSCHLCPLNSVCVKIGAL
jgi:endonuclease III